MVRSSKVLYGIRNICLRPVPLDTVGGHFVLRQALLQRRFSVALQLRIDRRMHGVRFGSQTFDALRPYFASEKIDELKAAVASRPVKAHERWGGRECLLLLLCSDDAVLLHAAEHVREAVLGAIRMTVRIEITWPFEQARQHRGFPKREVLCRLVKIATRGHLHAPRAAPKIGGIQIQLENLVFAQGGFQPPPRSS